TAAADVLGSGDVNAAPPVQDEQSVGFRGLEETVRAHNQTIQAFRKTLQGIENTDQDGQFFTEELQYQAEKSQYQAQAAIYRQCIEELSAVESSPAIAAQIEVAELNLKMCEESIATIDKAIAGLDDLQEEAENELEDTYASTEKQLENAANQIVVGAQTAYAGIITIRE